MQINYLKTQHRKGYDVDYTIRLNNGDRILLDKNHFLIAQNIIDLEEGVKNKSFKLMINATDDDSDFEIHYHPSGSNFDKTTLTHATITPRLYESLKEKKEVHVKHDHGLVEIILKEEGLSSP